MNSFYLDDPRRVNPPEVEEAEEFDAEESFIESYLHTRRRARDRRSYTVIRAEAIAVFKSGAACAATVEMHKAKRRAA
jgi:hypothetical protein